MLSTVDNPFNPWTQFDEWYSWDNYKGYHSLSFLDRVMVTSDDLSDADQLVAYNQALDEIVKEDELGLYIKVPNPASTPATQSDQLTA